METNNANGSRPIRRLFRFAVKKDSKEIAANNFVVEDLVPRHESDEHVKSYSQSNSDAAEWKFTRKSTLFAQNQESCLVLCHIVKAVMRYTNPFPLTKPCFVFNEALMRRLYGQRRKAIQEIPTKAEESRRKLIESAEIRKQMEELMAKEYQEVYMKKELASRDTCQKKYGEDDSTTEDKNDSTFESDYSENSEHTVEDYQEYSRTKPLPNDLCLKSVPEQNMNVSDSVNPTEEIKPRGQTEDVVPLEDSNELEENRIAFTKMLLVICLILFGLNPVAASPTQTNYETTGVYEYRMLQTSACNYTDLHFDICDRNEEMMSIYVNYCGFADLCDSGLKPVCANSDNGEILYFCSPMDLVCPKGYWTKVSRKVTNPNMVLVRIEKCPTGRYQPHESDCYDACRTRKGDIKGLPLQYAVYSKGDNISPAMIYCDFKRGFYSLDGRFLLKFDEEVRFQHLICTSVTDYNPCSREMYPIPNGTCVIPCEKGFERDVHDDFVCKELRWSETDLIKEEIHQAGNDLSQKTEGSADTSVLHRSLLNLGKETKPEDSRILNDWHVAIVKVLVFAAILLALVGLVFVMLEN